MGNVGVTDQITPSHKPEAKQIEQLSESPEHSVSLIFEYIEAAIQIAR